MADKDAINKNYRFFRTNFPPKVPRVILSMIEHQKKVQIHINILLVLLSAKPYQLQSL